MGTTWAKDKWIKRESVNNKANFLESLVPEQFWMWTWNHSSCEEVRLGHDSHCKWWKGYGNGSWNKCMEFIRALAVGIGIECRLECIRDRNVRTVGCHDENTEPCPIVNRNLSWGTTRLNLYFRKIIAMQFWEWIGKSRTREKEILSYSIKIEKVRIWFKKKPNTLLPKQRLWQCWWRGYMFEDS